MNIDKKLEEVVDLVAYARATDVSLNGIKPRAINDIKQAFIDAGWINIPNLKPGDFITVNYGTAVFNGDGTVTPIVRMTGREWYDKFTAEYTKLEGISGTGIPRRNADKAAKKAAGIR